MKKLHVHINSKLYTDLFSLGGDNLVAVYCMLKFSKNGEIKIYKEKNRNIYHTLKTKTNLSVTTLRKYVKQLVKLEVCYFDSVGNFVLKGNNKLNKEYKKKKLVRVKVGSYKQTRLFSFAVRIRTMERLQKKAIDRKNEQNKILARQRKGYCITKREKNFLKSCEMYKSEGDYNNAKTVLSNQGYSKLKKGYEASKSVGYYWKKNLVSAGIIKTERRFKFLRKGTLSDYLQNREFDRTVVYKKGKIYKELIPSFTTNTEAKKEVYKKKNYLQFDMIDFWINGAGK